MCVCIYVYMYSMYACMHIYLMYVCMYVRVEFEEISRSGLKYGYLRLELKEGSKSIPFLCLFHLFPFCPIIRALLPVTRLWEQVRRNFIRRNGSKDCAVLGGIARVLWTWISADGYNWFVRFQCFIHGTEYKLREIVGRNPIFCQDAKGPRWNLIPMHLHKLLGNRRVLNNIMG